MENASKALLIAGGVLIALIILATFIVMFNNMSNIKKEQEEQLKIEQLSNFNSEFEAYDKKLMYGTDVITLINKIAENNKKYATNNSYKITLTINDVEVVDSSQLLEANAELTIYECTKVEYNDLGRVSKIEIKIK